MNIFEEVKKLNFPKGSYVVVGSGHLIALDLKKGTDIDVLVTKELFKECIENGWEILPWTYPGTEGQTFLKKGLFELYLNVSCGDAPTSKELISNAVLMEGIPFARLEDILMLKKEYSKTKPKHLGDIKIIENYLSASIK
jgi:hypothetical protein